MEGKRGKSVDIEEKGRARIEVADKTLKVSEAAVLFDVLLRDSHGKPVIEIHSAAKSKRPMRPGFEGDKAAIMCKRDGRA